MIFETRNEEGKIKQFDTLKKAFEEADKDETVYKISDDEEDGRFRLRLIKRKVIGGYCWNYEPMLPFMDAFIDYTTKEARLERGISRYSKDRDKIFEEFKCKS